MPGGQLDYAPYESSMPKPRQQPLPPLPPKVKPTRWNKFKRWFKAAFCCCLTADEAESPVKPPTPPSTPVHGSKLPLYDPSESDAGPAPALYKTPGGMTMWNPESGTPCPHLLTTQHPRTGEKTCCHCKASV